MTRRGYLFLSGVLLLVGVPAYLLCTSLNKWKSIKKHGPAEAATATYEGANVCKECHEKEYQDWMGSDHQLAMQVATSQTVLGDFRNAKFDYYGVASRFFTKDGKFYVSTDGPDGKFHDFEIKYTFGIRPLQQYLIPFPDGRLQALSIAWDSRPKEQGGQRWFHLYAKENIRAVDELHWTGLQQNWNFMCAECHSTNVRKNYSPKTNTYNTTWSEINVSCEACHGAGSEHVNWAKAQPKRSGESATAYDGLLAHFDDRRDAYWKMNYVTGNSGRSRPRLNTNELEMCGRCHARRSELSEIWVPGKALLDTHLVALLDAGLYTADGQMQDEVYNYGSFLQSRMFHEGVTCSDCHDPHTQKLRQSKEEVCGICHYLNKYSSSQHHHHKEGTSEGSCIACHMPVRTYMVVDPRHDHSFRIPRPDESVKYGTPNACNDCHKNKSASWAAKATNEWYGPVHKGYQEYAEVLTAARVQSEPAAKDLATLAQDPNAPDIAKATALVELAPYLDSEAYQAAQIGLQSPNPLLRLAAVDLLSVADPDTRWKMLSPMLRDPVLAVRSAVANALVDAAPQSISDQDRESLGRAIADFLGTQQLNIDRPEGRLSLGNFYARQGRTADADAQYRAAITLWPAFIPAYVNLADLCRVRQQDDEAERWLELAQKQAPRNAEVMHSMGLLRVRQHRTAEAVALLEKAARLAPGNAHYAYVYGVGLYSSGKKEFALQILRRANESFPANREVLLGLAALSADAGNLIAARRYAEQFKRIAPGDKRGEEFILQLRDRGVQ